MARFTKEQWQEIYEARGRIQAWRDTFQFYPALPEEPSKEIPEPLWNRNQWDTVQQLRGEMRHLSSKVNEMRANTKKKDRYKYK